MSRLRSVFPATLVAALLISAAHAGSGSIRMATLIPCADPKSMAAMLRKFGEQQLARAVDAGDAPMVPQVNPETGTFTVLRRQPDGLICILAAGRDFKLTGKLIAGRDI